MNNVSGQTRLGQKGLLVAAFTTPFALIGGTGGYVHAQPLETTGNSIFVVGAHQPTREQINTAHFVKKLERLTGEFGLNKNQVSKIMGVSRPTIYSWFDGATDVIRDSHRQRLETIVTAIDRAVDENLRPALGLLLNRKLDPSVSKFTKLTSQQYFSVDELERTMKPLNFKLSGLVQSNALTSALKNKKPLI